MRGSFAFQGNPTKAPIEGGANHTRCIKKRTQLNRDPCLTIEFPITPARPNTSLACHSKLANIPLGTYINPLSNRLPNLSTVFATLSIDCARQLHCSGMSTYTEIPIDEPIQVTPESEPSSTKSISSSKTSEENFKGKKDKKSHEVENQSQIIRRKYVRGSRPARVTRISIEHSQEEVTAPLRPRLKNGIHLSAPIAEVETSLIIATAHHAITIHHPGARAIIAKFDGEHSAVEISQEINAPIDVVEKVITQLLNAHLIDVSKSKVRLHNRFHSPIAERAANTEDQSNDASFRQLQQRMISELSQTTWIEGVVDGGVQLLSARQNFGVEIHGNNRVATLIYNALLASGVTNTRFSITSRRSNSAIGDSDLGTGVLRATDYGLNYVNRLEELSREWSLFPTPSKNVKGSINVAIPERNLRIIVGQYPMELIDQLMRDGMDHFFVGQIVGGASLCGPLVSPAKSPCQGCVALGDAERFGMDQLKPLSSHLDELPVSISYQVAGVATHAVLQFIDTGSSEFLGTQLTFDYLSPVRGAVTRYARHPKCSCQWM